jgi:hypothetical protein
MQDDISAGPDSVPAKVTKPRAKAKAATVVVKAEAAPELAAAEESKPKARAKAAVEITDTRNGKIALDASGEVAKVPALVAGDAEQAEERKLDQARAEGAMQVLRLQAASKEAAEQNDALWEKLENQRPGGLAVEPKSGAQKSEFARLQRGQEQDAAAFAKATEAAKLAAVSPMTPEQSFAAARAQGATEKAEVENSIEADPKREVAADQEQEVRDTKLFESILHNMQHNMIAPHGYVTREDAGTAVAEDVAALRDIKDPEIRNRALMVMDESTHAQAQYGSALNQQAPDVAAEASAVRKTGRNTEVRQGINADARTANARRINIGKQMPATFAARHPSQPFPSDPAIDRTKAVPDAVRANYLRVGNEYFHMDKKPAFTDRGTKLTTKGANAEVIHSLVSIAKARGWDTVTVKGTKEFRRAAWHEASTNGLEVAGYTPSRVEQAHLAAAKDAKEKARSDNSLEQGCAVNIAKTIETPVQVANDKAPASMRDTVKEAPATLPAASHVPTFALPEGAVGKLIKHGKAPYMHDAKNEQSYFVTIEGAKGEKTVWGVDLDRAMKQSGAQVGEAISLESKPVEGSKRKAWTVGSLDKAKAFAQGKREEVIQAYPDLIGAYGTVAAATAFAKQHFPGHEERFVAIGRQIIAANIAAGKETPAVQIMETQIKAVDRAKQEDRERT